MITRNQWVLYFRPNQLMLTNTNNGTERINRELKMEELTDYENCSLSEMLKVVIKSFLPSMYHRYIALYIRYSNEYKKYQRSLPAYLKNLPKNIKDHILMTKGTVDYARIGLVEATNNSLYFRKWKKIIVL